MTIILMKYRKHSQQLAKLLVKIITIEVNDEVQIER